MRQLKRGGGGRLRRRASDQTRELDAALAFTVTHYAGEVNYSTEGWLEKNNALLSVEAEALIEASTHNVVKTLTQAAHSKDADEDTGEGGGTTSVTSVTTSVSKKYLRDLDKLLATLEECALHYIRTFKPNLEQKPGKWGGAVILDQMLQSGGMDLVKIMHSGYPNRMEFKYLLQRYQSALPDFKDEDPRTFLQALMLAFELPKSDYALGTSKLFLKSGCLAVVDKLTAGNDGKIPPEVTKKLRLLIVRKKKRRVLHVIQLCLWLPRFQRQIRNKKNAKLLLAAVRNYARVHRWGQRAAKRLRGKRQDALSTRVNLAWRAVRGFVFLLKRARRQISLRKNMFVAFVAYIRVARILKKHVRQNRARVQAKIQRTRDLLSLISRRALLVVMFRRFVTRRRIRKEAALQNSEGVKRKLANHNSSSSAATAAAPPHHELNQGAIMDQVAAMRQMMEKLVQQNSDKNEFNATLIEKMTAMQAEIQQLQQKNALLEQERADNSDRTSKPIFEKLSDFLGSMPMVSLRSMPVPAPAYLLHPYGTSESVALGVDALDTGGGPGRWCPARLASPGKMNYSTLKSSSTHGHDELPPSPPAPGPGLVTTARGNHGREGVAAREESLLLSAESERQSEKIPCAARSVKRHTVSYAGGFGGSSSSSSSSATMGGGSDVGALTSGRKSGGSDHSRQSESDGGSSKRLKEAFGADFTGDGQMDLLRMKRAKAFKLKNALGRAPPPGRWNAKGIQPPEQVLAAAASPPSDCNAMRQGSAEQPMEQGQGILLPSSRPGSRGAIRNGEPFARTIPTSILLPDPDTTALLDTTHRTSIISSRTDLAARLPINYIPLLGSRRPDRTLGPRGAAAVPIRAPVRRSPGARSTATRPTTTIREWVTTTRIRLGPSLPLGGPGGYYPGYGYGMPYNPGYNAARQSASLVGEVTRVAQPLTRTVADQVAALLSQVGRTKEAQEISDILLGSDEGRNSSEMQVAAGRSTKGRAGALTGPGVGAQLPVISESFNSTAALAIAAPQPGEQQENAVASSDGAGVDLDEIDPDTYGDKGVKYWQPPELAAPLAVENALAGMQRRQLSQLEAKIGDQRTELRQIDDGIKRKERDLAELQRKAAALQRDLQREREKRLRKKSLLDLREEQAEKLRERVVELEGLLHEGRMEIPIPIQD
eukprot:g6185.t1